MWARVGVTSLAMAVLASGALLGGCSRDRVESVTAMNRGVELAEHRRFPEAVEQLERAAALDPTNAAAPYNLALVYMKLRAWNKAADALERTIAIKGDVASYHEKLGTVAMQLSEWKRAKGALERAIELDPALFKAHYKLAQVDEHLDDPQAALYAYTHAIERGPRFVEAYIALGRLYADLGYPKQAVQVLREGEKAAIPSSEALARLHNVLGTVYQQQGDYEAAIRELQAALTIVPGMPSALFALGWTYALRGDRDDARKYLERFIQVADAQTPESYVAAARERLAAFSEQNEAQDQAQDEPPSK